MYRKGSFDHRLGCISAGALLGAAAHHPAQIGVCEQGVEPGAPGLLIGGIDEYGDALP